MGRPPSPDGHFERDLPSGRGAILPIFVPEARDEEEGSLIRLPLYRATIQHERSGDGESPTSKEPGWGPR